jgi:predicted nucleic acid-binding protein
MARRQRRRTEAPPQRLTLDSGAVVALSRGEQRARAFLQRAIELDAEICVPVVVLAETLRGGPSDASVHRVVNLAGESKPTTSAIGRRAGEILGRTGRSDTVDALVVAEADLAGGGQILTGDPDDLQVLASAIPSIAIRSLTKL